jgi:hypothetical protein
VRIRRVVVVPRAAVDVVDRAVVVEVLQVVVVAVDVERSTVLLQQRLQVGYEVRSGAVFRDGPNGVCTQAKETLHFCILTSSSTQRACQCSAPLHSQ